MLLWWNVGSRSEYAFTQGVLVVDVVGNHSVGVDLDFLLCLGLLHLRDDDTQDSILHAGLDVFVVDRVGKGEAARKLTNAALRDPVGMLWIGPGDFLGASGGHFFARGLLSRVVPAFGTDFGGGGLGTFLSQAFGPAFDGDGLLVGKLNNNILLVYTRQLAFENVIVLCFLDVELWCERARCGVGQFLEFGEGVVEEIEEWGDFGAIGSEGGWHAWKESHVSSLVSFWLRD